MVSRKHEWLTVPNALTLVRLGLLVPLGWMIITGYKGWAPLLLMIVWSGSDWLDGFLARELGQSSRVGEVLDPIADRLGILVVTVSLCASGALSWFFPVVIGGTDAVVAALAGRAAAAGRIHVNMLGKVRSAVLFLGLVTLVASASLMGPWTLPAFVLLGVGTALHVVAGAIYIREARVRVNPAIDAVGT